MTRRVETVRRGDRQVRVHEVVLSGCLLVAATSVDRAVVVACCNQIQIQIEKINLRKRKEDVQRITCLKEDDGCN